MEAMVAEAMDAGAFGLSTGLRYTPGAFSKTEEVIALARVAGARGGIYTSHLRDEGMQLMDGVGEAIRIGREGGIPVVLTHHKVVGSPMWGASERTLAMIDEARAAGVDVMADQYPYTATYTGITILAPPWALAGGTDVADDREHLLLFDETAHVRGGAGRLVSVVQNDQAQPAVMDAPFPVRPLQPQKNAVAHGRTQLRRRSAQGGGHAEKDFVGGEGGGRQDRQDAQDQCDRQD
jgi:hypothetical protein